MRKLAETTYVVDAATLEQALNWLEDSARAQQWPARTAFKLRLCLDELLTNLAMHGKPGGPEAGPLRVILRMFQDAQQLKLEILDNGTAFDPTAQTPRDLDTSLEDAELGGHGLRLLRHYLEDIRYERLDDWNRLELIADIDHA